MLDKICHHCATVFQISEREHGIAINRGQSKFYCTNVCVGLSQRTESIKKICAHCSVEFSKKRFKPNQSGLHFCSMSCSSSHRERKPKVALCCKHCGEHIPPRSIGKKNVCDLCFAGDTISRTKGDLFKSRSSYQSYRSGIQSIARILFFKHVSQPSCAVCGYTKHVEVCHIKSVSSFHEDTLISEINHIDNLMGLCPTHHWEFDNDQLDSK